LGRSRSAVPKLTSLQAVVITATAPDNASAAGEGEHP